MREIFRTSLRPDYPKEELRLILVTIGDSLWVNLEVQSLEGNNQSDAPARRVTLPLSLWPRFHEAVCCPGCLYETPAGAGLPGQILL